MKLISRKEAMHKGLKTYFTGRPCRRGHVCLRYVGFSNCVECAQLDSPRPQMPNERKDQILAAATIVARKPGAWTTMTRSKIAAEAKCSEALVSRYLGNMSNVRRAILKIAVKDRDFAILAQSLVARDIYSTRIPCVLHRKALSSLLG